VLLQWPGLNLARAAAAAAAEGRCLVRRAPAVGATGAPVGAAARCPLGPRPSGLLRQGRGRVRRRPAAALHGQQAAQGLGTAWGPDLGPGWRAWPLARAPPRVGPACQAAHRPGVGRGAGAAGGAAPAAARGGCAAAGPLGGGRSAARAAGGGARAARAPRRAARAPPAPAAPPLPRWWCCGCCRTAPARQPAAPCPRPGLQPPLLLQLLLPAGAPGGTRAAALALEQ
jgi:hypothetical protein